MTPAHTPGPWIVERGRLGTFYVDVIDDGVAIAEMFGINAEANARLIAAAPQLLAALRALLGVANRLQPDMNLIGLRDSARAAIASATGESQ